MAKVEGNYTHVNWKERAQDFVTKFIARIESGNVSEWRKTWSAFDGVDGFCNAETGHAYKGGNVLQVLFDMMNNGYPTGRYLTYNQVKTLAAKNGKQGFVDYEATKKGIALFFALPKFVTEKDENGIEKEVMRGLNWRATKPLFNIALTDLGELFGQENETTDKVLSDGENGALHLLSSEWNAAHENTAQSAYYSPILDRIYMPKRASFETNVEYIATLAHEKAHGTGHKSRLSRNLTGKFGEKSYAYEELVAESAALMFLYSQGLEPNEENTAAYLSSWLKKAKDVAPDAFYRAFGKAHEAAFWMQTGQKMSNKKETEE